MPVSHNSNNNNSSGTNETSLNLTRIICLNNNFGLFLRIVKLHMFPLIKLPIIFFNRQFRVRFSRGFQVTRISTNQVTNDFLIDSFMFTFSRVFPLIKSISACYCFISIPENHFSYVQYTYSGFSGGVLVVC